ncbi:MAG TPA: KEOPS complex subunit Pcc1 [Thermoplasmata archaeon]|nr:KEOPS complex subunit Pcc1 [Thermoplasmata archaeon]
MTVTVRRACASAAEADALAAAVRADSPEFVGLAVEGPALVIRVRSPSAASARATFEDLMACLKVAERTIAVAPPAAASTGPRPRGGGARRRSP